MAATYLLFFRLVLLASLLLQYLYSGAPDGGGWVWSLFGGYGAVLLALFALERSGRLPRAFVPGAFLLDIALTSALLYRTGGGGSDFYIAYFLVILSSCFLQNLAYSFIVGGVACVVYGALAFPEAGATYDPSHLLRLAFLLAATFYSTYMADLARSVERAVTERYQERLAWMERLSMVGRAVAGVFHETKTPLSTILLNVEYARELVRKKRDVAEPLDIIGQEAQRACDLLAEFLEFSKPTDLELKPLEIEPVLRRVLETMRVRLREKEITVEETLGEGTPVPGSEKHLVQVFSNVILNAIDAMPLGGHLRVRQEVENGQILIRIADNGVGIEPDRLKLLFEPFAASRPGSQGHGLGLSIARWILHKHSGDIQLVSPGPRKGTEVFVSLPLAPKS